MSAIGQSHQFCHLFVTFGQADELFSTFLYWPYSLTSLWLKHGKYTQQNQFGLR